MKCKCTMSQKMVGDGCEVCNTAQAIEYMPTPVEIAEDLKDSGFTQGQAEAVAAEIYQPLIGFIEILSDKIDALTSNAGGHDERGTSDRMKRLVRQKLNSNGEKKCGKLNITMTLGQMMMGFGNGGMSRMGKNLFGQTQKKMLSGSVLF